MFVFLLGTLTILIALYIRNKFNYWKNKNINQVKWSFFKGVFGLQSFSDTILELYNSNEDARYVINFNKI